MQEITRPMAVPKVVITERKKKKRLTVFWISSMFLIVLILAAIFGILAYLDINQVILADVHVYDMDLSYKTKMEAEAQLDHAWNNDKKILLSLEDTLYEVNARDLGLSVDTTTTTDKAYLVGRQGNILQRLKAFFPKNAAIVLPDPIFNEIAARQILTSFAQTIYIPPTEATVQRVDNAYQAVPGKAGAALDVETPLAQIKANPLLVLTQGKLNLTMLPVQPEVADLTPLLDEISIQLQQKFTLTAYDPILDEYDTWTVPPETLIEWLQVDQAKSSAWLEPELDTIEPLLEEWNESLEPERSLHIIGGAQDVLNSWINFDSAKGQILHNPTNYVVQPGESLWSISLKLGMPLFRITDANPGLTQYNLYAGQDLVIPSLNDLLPLPVIENKRIIVSITEQKMWTYENDELRSEHVVSTGMDESPTMAGIFQIQSRYLDAYASNWDLWMPHFLGIYEAWPEFMNGIHGLPLLSSGVRLWGGSLGTPASYGCIILDLEAAESLYYWAEDGVVVEILP